jgi:glycosyltransferase involved in cell wall biosynthesis
MSVISAITTCKGRLEHLKRTLPTAVGQPGMSHVLVDWSCPQGAGDWARQEYGDKVRVVKVPGQASFNPSASRNVGAQRADGRWLMFRDADISLASSFAERVIPLLAKGFFYVPKRDLQGPWAGVVVMSRADYLAVGGYDDVMQGWGYEDKDMYTRLQLAGVKVRLFPEELIGWIDHDNAMRVQYYDVKHRDVSRLINTLYSMAKNDLWNARHPGKTVIDHGFRRALYAQIHRLMPQLLRSRGSKVVKIAFPPSAGGPDFPALEYVVDTERGLITRAQARVRAP